MTDTGKLISRTKNILFKPAATWEEIIKEDKSVRAVSRSFLIPLLVLVSLSAFAGTLIYTSSKLSILYPVIRSLKHFTCFYITILLSALVLNELSLACIKTRNYAFNFRLVTYSLTPLFTTVFITRLLPDLALINLLGFYGIYILYRGIHTIENTEKQKLLNYFIVALLTVTTLYFSISWISRSLFEGLYFAFAGSI
ncbi:MAG: Yip1 family protein [Bacteroidales bacterium]|nr:Yip1 family protein [Bacteroidales bacterium]